jgi:hypothetical protein
MHFLELIWHGPMLNMSDDNITTCVITCSNESSHVEAVTHLHIVHPLHVALGCPQLVDN